MWDLDYSSALSIHIFLSVLATVLSFSLTAFSVICNKTFYKVYTLLSHTHLTTLSQLLAVGGVTVVKAVKFCGPVNLEQKDRLTG